MASLHLACLHGRPLMVDLLLRMGATPDLVPEGNTGHTPLCCAIAAPEKCKVEELEQCGLKLLEVSECLPKTRGGVVVVCEVLMRPSAMPLGSCSMVPTPTASLGEATR